MPGRFFRLGEEREVLACSAQEWFEQVLQSDRRVAETLIGGMVVSTMFWGVTHPAAGDPPLVFESRVWPDLGLTDLAASIEEALANHARIVAELSGVVDDVGAAHGGYGVAGVSRPRGAG